MNIVVDTNIVFSGILNPNGVIADLLINSDKTFNFYAPTFILKKLSNHQQKMKKISGLSDDDISFLKRVILKNINLIDEQYIRKESWIFAKELTENIDEFDIPFIALCIELQTPLWTGDKKLTKGLLKKDIDWILNTQNLIEISNI